MKLVVAAVLVAACVPRARPVPKPSIVDEEAWNRDNSRLYDVGELGRSHASSAAPGAPSVVTLPPRSCDDTRQAGR